MKKPRANKHGQYSFFKRRASDHGGILRHRRSGRGARPIAVKHSMHLVLRSTQAKGDRSFRKPINANHINRIIKKFATKYSVTIISFANVGNHLHLHLRLGSRQSYKPFIRAVTGAIAHAVTRAKKLITRFWNERPFTRIVQGYKDAKGVEDYVTMNHYEGQGYSRQRARRMATKAYRNPKPAD